MVVVVVAITVVDVVLVVLETLFDHEVILP